jgi:hypothetical protein
MDEGYCKVSDGHLIVPCQLTGAHDGVVDEREVWNFALKNWENYQTSIQKFTGLPMTFAPQITPNTAFLKPDDSRKPEEGRFYIVGMGTADDLITFRGAAAIKQADFLLVSDEQGKEDWKEFIGNKEVWVFPRFNLLYYGIDPETLTDPRPKRLPLNMTQNVARWLNVSERQLKAERH